MTYADVSEPAELPLSSPRAREIVEGVCDGFISVDPDWGITDCNPGAEALLGRRRSELLGQRLSSIAGFSSDSAAAELGRRVARNGKPEEAEVDFQANARTKLLLVRAFPLAGGVGVVWRDITRVRAAERRLAASQSHHREVANDLPAPAWLTRKDGQLVFINESMAEALGRPRADLLGLGWMDSIDPDDRMRLDVVRAHARENAAPVQYEGRFRRPDGGLRIIQLYGRPRFDRMGRFCGHVGIATDVTEVRAAENQQRLLINELNHRVKNALAIVQALVRQTLREQKASPELAQAIEGRIFALAAAHDVLTRQRWVGAEMGALAKEATKPYSEYGAFGFSGPTVTIAPKSAIALSMALHELATNAIKYGALSSPTGQVAVSWGCADGAIKLEWRESGGPPVAPPEQKGFGSRLLGRVLEGELGGPAELDYAPTGLVCRIRAPIDGP
ncbi:MAG TPA: HWE histidine kinase domain-containing protein [Caulobacteraceae bacterium]|jgi:PAS domain S-box-containing protein